MSGIVFCISKLLFNIEILVGSVNTDSKRIGALVFICGDGRIVAFTAGRPKVSAVPSVSGWRPGNGPSPVINAFAERRGHAGGPPQACPITCGSFIGAGCRARQSRKGKANGCSDRDVRPAVYHHEAPAFYGRRGRLIVAVKRWMGVSGDDRRSPPDNCRTAGPRVQRSDKFVVSSKTNADHRVHGSDDRRSEQNNKNRR